MDETAITVGYILQGLTLFAVACALVQLVDSRQHSHREFESHFVQRYWQLMDRRSANFRQTGALVNAEEQDFHVCRDYLQLCEDEIDLRKSGRVSRGTWEIWKSGMLGQCSEEIYEHELKNHSGQWRSLRQMIDAEPTFDPLKMPKFRQRMLGLH